MIIFAFSPFAGTPNKKRQLAKALRKKNKHLLLDSACYTLKLIILHDGQLVEDVVERVLQDELPRKPEAPVFLDAFVARRRIGRAFPLHLHLQARIISYAQLNKICFKNQPKFNKTNSIVPRSCNSRPGLSRRYTAPSSSRTHFPNSAARRKRSRTSE